MSFDASQPDGITKPPVVVVTGFAHSSDIVGSIRMALGYEVHGLNICQVGLKVDRQVKVTLLEVA